MYPGGGPYQFGLEGMGKSWGGIWNNCFEESGCEIQLQKTADSLIQSERTWNETYIENGGSRKWNKWCWHWHTGTARCHLCRVHFFVSFTLSVMVESGIGSLEYLEYFVTMFVEEDPALSESTGHILEGLDPGIGSE
jgi:hypothetical protein